MLIFVKVDVLIFVKVDILIIVKVDILIIVKVDIWILAKVDIWILVKVDIQIYKWGFSKESNKSSLAHINTSNHCLSIDIVIDQNYDHRWCDDDEWYFAQNQVKTRWTSFP